jgi:hypothetical protein
MLIALVLAMSASTGCTRTLLDERFHDSRLIGWTVVDDPDVLEGPSHWQVGPDAWLHQSSNVWGRRGDFIGRWYGTFLIAGREDWSDYTFSVKARPEDDDGFGVVFRYRDPEHFYRLIMVRDGLNGGPLTRLDKRDGADYTELWSAPSAYRTQTEATIEISVTDNRIKATVDGRVLFELEDGSYAQGKVGLFCFAQAGQAFDDARVTGR